MSQRSIRIGITGAVAGALLLAACSSGGSTAGPASVSASGKAAPAATLDPEGAALAADAADFAALSPADQEKELATTSLSAELALLPESDAAAYKAMTTALVAYAEANRANPSFVKFGAGPIRAEDIGYGGMLFAGWMLTGLGVSAAVTGSNDANEGAPPETRTDMTNSSTITSETTFSGSVENAAFEMTTTSTEKDMSGTMHLKGTVNPCPDVGGLFKAKVLLEASGASSSSSGTIASAVDISLQGVVDDAAHVVGYETTTNTRANDGKRGLIADSSVTMQRTGDTSTLTGYKDNGGTTGTATESRQWAFLGMLTEAMVVDQVMKAITKAIESGRCVKLNAPTTPAKTTKLKPSTAVSISAQPRSKVDGKPTGGTVTGTLEGGAALDPAGTAVDADATFSYTAPDKEDERATVKLEARSLRGVGRAEIPMDTNKAGGYAIDETIGMYRYSGKACSIAGPWTITYTLLGMPGLKGEGTYKLAFPREPDASNESDSVAGTGTEKGKIVAVGLPGGVKFNAGLTATLTPSGSDYIMVVKSTGGSSTAWAENKQKNGTVGVSTVELHAKEATGSTCPAA